MKTISPRADTGMKFLKGKEIKKSVTSDERGKLAFVSQVDIKFYYFLKWMHW